jgi:apolipoprotein N-acyltransferase
MRLSVLISILLSALCYYFGNGLTGDYWYLVWIAPAPILYTSVNASKKTTFIMAFLAYLLGRMSWLAYLVRVATLMPAITALLLSALIFAGIILLHRSITLRLKSWYALFAFPLSFTAFEYLLLKFSADGTAGSIAYSQMDFLPVIQVAAVGGILAITLLITLLPSFIVFAILYPGNKIASACMFIFIAGVLVWGHLRITDDHPSLKVGLAVAAEAHHNYPRQIDSLAAQG